MVLKETLSYYVNNGGSVFCTFLTHQMLLTGLIIVNYLNCQYIECSNRLVFGFYFQICAIVMSVASHGLKFARFLFFVLNLVRQDGVISDVLYCIYFDELVVNWLMQELADILGIFSMALLQTQNTLCFQLIWLGLCDLCFLFVIIMLYNIRLFPMVKQSKCTSFRP